MTAKLRVLVVDDSADTLELVQRNLNKWGYSVFTAASVEDALEAMRLQHIDIVITDLKMPRISGLDLLRHIHDNYPGIATMMLTGYGTIENAVDAIKEGASEYLCKPFTEQELKEVLDKLTAHRRFLDTASDASVGAPLGLIGESAPMRKLYSLIEKAAATSATVLIMGESGTGKELVARAIHYKGGRASAPFVPVNCGGIPETLLESELFGHVKGAFSGAFDSRAGFFVTADGGTIFLDEIGETSSSMQVKLLRVLQDKTIYMVGSSKGRNVAVRVIAATNKDLQTLVDKGLFRADLFFRLNVLTMQLPPLRERGDDVLLLAAHFLKKFKTDYGKGDIKFTERALTMMSQYSWPGNVRELENLIQRLVVMADSDSIDSDLLPPHMRYSLKENPSTARPLADVEAEHILAVLAGADGNRTLAASILGIDRKTLREKLRKHGMPND